MTLRIIQLGTPRHPEEGLRLGTVRRPPRGVPKSEYARRDFFDLWLPELAPSAALLAAARGAKPPEDPAAFLRAFRAEMNLPGPSHLLDLLAALSSTTQLSLGCYCQEESACHRSVLRDLLATRGAQLA